MKNTKNSQEKNTTEMLLNNPVKQKPQKIEGRGQKAV